MLLGSRSSDEIIYPSEVAEKHISEKVGQSYPITKAIDLMTETAELGFGTLETATTTNNCTVKQFRKRLNTHYLLSRVERVHSNNGAPGWPAQSHQVKVEEVM